MTTALTQILLEEILRDGHRYVRGRGQHVSTLAGGRSTRRRLEQAAGCGRDLVERAAGSVGFTRRHYDPMAAAAGLSEVLAMGDGLQRTWSMLADDPSRRALIDVLKLRILGPFHAPLPLTPERFRGLQSQVDQTLLRQPATFEVPDPFFSPISLYEVPAGDGGPPVSLHAHSVDIVSVFVLGQYAYKRGGVQVAAAPGDVVLDIGGCWGDTALAFARRVGPTGRVYTFEFDPANLRIMHANLALNPELADRIEIVEKAVWDRSGEELGFAVAGRMTSTIDPGRSGDAPTASTVTLDDFAAGLERIDLVKMDVEGAEPRVLSGGQKALARFAPKLAVAAYHRADDLVRLPELILASGAGYDFFIDTFSPLEDETVLFAAPAGPHSG